MLKKDHRIAVIGGGLSGLVIADGLQRKGYRNVTIFEKDDRIGGKLHTIWYKGKSYELGAIFGLPSQRNLKDLMKRLHIKADGPKLSRINYNAAGQRIMPIPKDELGNFVKEMDRLPTILEDYKSLKSPVISYIEPSLMLPFSKWCDLHEFRVLKTIFIHYFTIFGMGNIDEVPALYVLKIINYEHLMSFLELPEFATWNDGVYSLANALKEKIEDIRLGQSVVDIVKCEEDKLLLKTQYENLEYDKAVITAPLDQFSRLSLWDNEMKENLERIKYQAFNVYAFIGNNVPKGCCCVLENLSENRQGHVTICDSRWVTDNEENMFIIYAYDPPNNCEATAMEIIKDDLSKLGIKNPRLYQTKRWMHSPFVDTDGLKKGFYEKVDSMQGKNNIYLAGEVMSTLSMENSISYSLELLNRFF